MQVRFHIILRNCEGQRLLATEELIFSGTRTHETAVRQAASAMQAAARDIGGQASLAMRGVNGELAELADHERITGLWQRVEHLFANCRIGAEQEVAHG